VKPNINISTDDEYAFRWSCFNEHLEVAKCLLKVKPNINISANNDFAFRLSCVNEQLKVAKLLLQHKTQNYYIFANKNKNQIEKIYGKNQQIAKQI